jgi:sodium transport system permease protein
MVFGGSMSIGMAITAGEKDKGTLASLLVNQVSRSSIAIGKSLFLVVSSLISASANVLGIVAATVFMRLYFNPSGGGGSDPMSGVLNFTGSLTEPANLVVFVMSLLCASGLAASIVVFLGTKARNMKEAGGYIMPVHFLILVAGMATLQMDTTRNIAFYLIPLINTVFVIKSTIVASLSLPAVLTAFAVNLACIALFVWLTTREFNSERVLYTE